MKLTPKNIDFACLDKLEPVLGKPLITRLKEGAVKMNTLERKYERIVDKLYEEMNEKIRINIELYQKLDDSIFEQKDFERILFMLLMQTSTEAVKTLHDPDSEAVQKESRLAKGKPGGINASLASLRKMWDEFRKTGKVPKRISKVAGGIRKAYLNKVQGAFQKNFGLIEEGSKELTDLAVKNIQKEAKITQPRAKMIVRTESTYYYNKARVELYNPNKDITHYLFLAVRDSKTTPWCKEGVGRHGIVYTKGTKVFEDEQAPCHYNCRSEIVPLTKHNPAQRKFIDDLSRRRENRNPTPLPKGWGKR